MMNTYEISTQEKYYAASELAEILGLDKNTILNRCKKGYYMGAVKAGPSQGNPHGMWLIPKHEIDNPTMTRDVATLTRQITPSELEKTIGQAIAYAVTTAVEPLHQEISELKTKLDTMEKSQELLRVQGLSIIKLQEDFITETRAERQAKKSRWKFWD